MSTPIAPFHVTPRLPSRYVQFSLPLPRGLWTFEPGVTPVRVYDGARAIPAQVERIMRYPDASAASLMVYADAGAPVASVRVEWDVHREPQEEFQYADEIKAARRWLGSLASGRTTMDGPVVRQTRNHTPHGEAWFTFFHDSPAIRVDAIVHNALPGDAEDYFDMVSVGGDVEIPPDWEVTWAIVEPLGQSNGEIEDESQHFFAQRAVRILRAVLAPKDYLKWTEAHPAYGWATVPRLWQTTPAWAPHFYTGPDLSHRTQLDAEQSSAFQGIRSALANGTNFPPYKKPDGSYSYPLAVRHGFFHPSYATEGGETGGYGITYGPAGDVVQTGNPDALLHAMYQQRMRRDRDRSACIEPDGEPSTYEQRRVEIDSGKIRFSADDPGRFDKSGSVVLDGSFGWSKQIPAPASAERTALLAYETTDWAHRIRATFWDLALLQLANDPVSRFLVRMDGEVARMAWHSGNRDDADASAANAGIGLPVDRIRGWMLHAMGAAYCAGNSALRDRFLPDMEAAGAIYGRATSRGPTLNALTSGKQVSTAPYNNQYAVCVAIQEGLLTQGFSAAARAIGYELAWGRIVRAVRYLLAGPNTVWSAAVWKLSDRDPFTVRNPALDSTAAGFTAGSKYDSEQTRGLIGLVLHFQAEAGGPSPDALDVFERMLGTAPRATLRKMGAGVLDSDSVCLSAADRLGLP